MSKRVFSVITLFVMIIIFTVGCSKNPNLDSSDRDTKDTGIVSVERFMEYYGVTDTDIPRDYILDFIMQYRLREDTLAKEDYWAVAQEDYANGVVYGTDTGGIFLGTPSELQLEEYIKTADVIVIEFEMY